MYGRQRYKKDKVVTAQPGELVVMLYDGILRFTGEAIRALDAREPAALGHAIRRTLDIIYYLQASLRSDVAESLVEQLDRTYTLWATALVRANAQSDADAIEGVRIQATDLRDAWAEAHATAQLQAQIQPQAAGAPALGVRSAA